MSALQDKLATTIAISPFRGEAFVYSAYMDFDAGRISDEEISDLLYAALQHSHSSIRRVAVELLTGSAFPGVEEKLRSRALVEEDLLLREELLYALDFYTE